MKYLSTDKIYGYIDYIIPAVFVLSFFECYFSIWRLATIVKFVSILFTIILLVKGSYKNTKILFNAFIMVSILSVFAYIYNNRPIECLESDVMNTIPAMLFFWVGANDDRRNRNFYNYMMYCGCAILLLGILCYIFTPAWYTQSLLDVLNNSEFSIVRETENSMLQSLRFSGFFEDSYPVSLLSVDIVAISLFALFSKHRMRYSLICFIISFTAAVLCMHRVSIASALLIIFAFLIYEIYIGKSKKIIGIIIGITIIIVCISIFSESFRDRLFTLQDIITSRTEDMSFLSAYSERQELSNKLLSQWEYPIFGHGIGSGGPASRFMGYGGVTDAGYIKLLFENGIVGLSLFLALAIGSIYRGIKYLKYYITEVSVICFTLLAMTGSDTLSLAYLYILPFWYMMGKIWNRNYLQYLKENHISL